ncbi:MAG: hypothetical protein R6W78_03560, partial [Bacteroidales bacterium]
MKKLKTLVFLILPVLLFVLGMMVKSRVGYYHLFTSDPAYAYLLNGLALCDFNIPWLVQGPGTPLILYCAIVMPVVHLFRGQDTLIIDVMQNPDIYLSIITTSVIAIQSLLLFLMGLLIFKSSKKILTGLFFQLTPFVSCVLIEILRLV